MYQQLECEADHADLEDVRLERVFGVCSLEHVLERVEHLLG